jgi:hypothetical protein
MNIKHLFIRDGRFCADCNAYFLPDEMPQKMAKFGDDLVCIKCAILRINADKTLGAS